MKNSFVALLLLFALTASAQTRNFEIYWIDVEGGASTLFVSPTGESLLFDTGFPGNGDRDAKRIYAAAQDAGLKQIDHVVISHWHADHEGGLNALSKMIPLSRFYDHGNGVEQADRGRLEDYKAIAGSKRTIVKPADTIPFGPVQVRVLVSEGPVIANAINGGGPNPLCANHQQMEPAPPENQRMVGLSLTWGNFKLASLGDLDWQRELELVCPVNKIGSVTVYTINRHGALDNSGTPALLGAIRPQVIVVNNGPRKGLGVPNDQVKPITVSGVTPAPFEKNHYLRLAKTPGVIDVWQGHLSLTDKDPAHNAAPERIANLEEGAADKGNFIHASVRSDGTYTITNGRNGYSKSYRSTTPSSAENKGTVEHIKVHGKSLEGNLEGDSPDRDVFVYLPPRYQSNANRRYPVVYLLHGYGLTAERWMSFANLAELSDKDIATGTMKEMILVNPDAHSIYDGSMYSASLTTGDWETYIAEDLVSYIDTHYRSIPNRMSRGLGGHSMGGYGTVRIGMKRPDVFSSLYIMSACCLLTNPYAQANRGAAPASAAAPAAAAGQRGQARGNGFANVGSAQAAAWASNPNNPPKCFDLPTKDGVVQPLIAAKYMANSPLVMIDQYVTNLRKYHAIMGDVGTADTLAASNRQLDEIMAAFGIKHTFETYEGDHTNHVKDRFEQKVLPFFSNNLSFGASSN